MLDDRDRNTDYKDSQLGCQVERLWKSVENPILIASLRVEEAITKAREEVDVVITSGEVTIRHRMFHALLSSDEEGIIGSSYHPEELSAHLQALGIFELKSAGQSMDDGALAEIAAKGVDGENQFWERSEDKPQAAVREFLLGLARERKIEVESEDAEPAPLRSESEMTFVVIHPTSNSEGPKKSARPDGCGPP